VTAAGVTKPVLYYYFRNKEGIYLELMRSAFSSFDALLDAARNEVGSPSERLLRLSDQVFCLFLEKMEFARLMYSIYYGPHQGAPFFDFDAFHFKFHDMIQQLVEEGIRRGEFRKENPEEMTWGILGAVNIAMELELCHPERGMGREGLGHVLAVIFQGISANKGEKKGERK
jgi:AcrR family transcriptional regulator